MKEYLKRGAISFMISAFSGLMVNLIMDLIVNAVSDEKFTSISPFFLKHFESPVMAAYVNILLYGVIGFTFSTMTFVFDLERVGFLIQAVIYFIVTAGVFVAITVILWQLHRRPEALVSSLAGYAVTYVIMCVVMYKQLRKDMEEINRNLNDISVSEY